MSNTPETTELTRAILHEIAESLRAFVADGTTRSIDLRSLPMSDADRATLEARLGRGEVSIALEVAGSSEIWETRYAGVWWIRHADATGTPLCETLEITHVPALVASSPSDIAASSRRLHSELGEFRAQSWEDDDDRS